MDKQYDLGKMKSRPNPYAGRLRQQVTLRLRRDTVEYLNRLADMKVRNSRKREK